MKKILLAAALSSSLLIGSTSVSKISDSVSSLDLTIYTNGQGMISEIRDASFKKGFNKIIYEGIPTRIVKSSVIPLFNVPGLTFYSQNYSFDTINFQSLSKEFLGKEILYKETEESSFKGGTLLSLSPVMIKDSTSKHVVAVNKSSYIKFPFIPSDMNVKPSLFWKLNSPTDLNSSVNLKYLSSGLNWNSDYILDLEEDNLTINGFFNVRNDSGRDYLNANLSFVAGEVNKIKKRYNRSEAVMEKGFAMDSMVLSAAPAVKQESFSGFHLYKVPFKEDIRDKESKQISFLNKGKVEYKNYALTQTLNLRSSQNKLRFFNMLEFKNSKENNLGIPLPKGVVRIYKKDSNGKSRFAGEDRVINTPKNESVKVKMGQFFDITGSYNVSLRKQYKQNMFKHESEIKLFNRANKKNEIRFEMNLPNNFSDKNIFSSCTSQKECSLTQEGNKLKFKVQLNKNSEIKIKNKFDFYN